VHRIIKIDSYRLDLSNIDKDDAKIDSRSNSSVDRLRLTKEE